jgi:hypothetical protein
MNLVYFDRQLSDLAPNVIGAFCHDPGARWATLIDIMTALDNRESVTIRPASESELQRAESIIALHEVTEQLASRFGGLLDSSEPQHDAEGNAE